MTEDALIDYIVEEVKKLAAPSAKKPCDNNSQMIPLGISNRHLHLTRPTFERLFGANTAFESLRPLYQPGEFASKHTVTLIGPKQRSIQGVRILGPLRDYDQVEITLTDAITLGINPPVVNSGTLDEAAPLTIVGPAGSVYLPKCAIIASRHVHMPPDDAARFGLKDGDYCKVRVGGRKSTVFENVLVRIKENWRLQIHLDTDDANAADIRTETSVEFLGKMN